MIIFTHRVSPSNHKLSPTPSSLMHKALWDRKAWPTLSSGRTYSGSLLPKTRLLGAGRLGLPSFSTLPSKLVFGWHYFAYSAFKWPCAAAAKSGSIVVCT
eukprot:1158368-Pelagomonas_calceolata.AAC.8